MARSNFVKKARTDIYRNGKKTKADNKNGFRIDRSQPEDKNDELLVKKGEPYYWWQFNFNPHKYISTTPPRQSQLTQSEFLSTLYGIQETIQDKEFSVDNFDGELEEIIDEIQTLLDETQEKFDNMPEQLQENSSSGETLTERLEALESWISDLQNIDTTIEHDDESLILELNSEREIENWLNDEADGDYIRTLGEYKEDAEKKIGEIIQEAENNKKDVSEFNITDNEKIKLDPNSKHFKIIFIKAMIKHLIILDLRKNILDEKADEIRDCECSL